MRQANRREIFGKGMKDGIPIALGYFAVSFSLGVAAKKAGLNPFQGFLVSILNNASAGEYAGFRVIAANSAYVEIILMTLVANARYLLMSCALSQRFTPEIPFVHRFLMAFDLTDELFGITIARAGKLEPFYTYGAVSMALPAWSIGTALGIIAGNGLPIRVVSALSVALYGMFIAIIIPPAKHDRVVGVLVLICFACSYFSSILPVVSNLSEGTRTIILTIVVASVAAVFFPIKEETEKNM